MMRPWREEFGRKDRRGSGMGVGTSIVVHAVLITAAVIATNPPEGLVQGLYNLANKVVYIAPPPRVPHSEGSKEQLKFVPDAPPGEGAGVERGPTPSEEPDKTKGLTFTTRAGDRGSEDRQASDEVVVKTYDSVFTILEVDSEAQISPLSAAPEYPPALQKLGIEGRAVVRYVVDSFGVPDVSTFKVVSTTRPEFAAAVKAALPRMLFVPAKMGERHVAQLVEQPFGFRVIKPDTTTDTVSIAAAAGPPA